MAWRHTEAQTLLVPPWKMAQYTIRVIPPKRKLSTVQPLLSTVDGGLVGGRWLYVCPPLGRKPIGREEQMSEEVVPKKNGSGKGGLRTCSFFKNCQGGILARKISSQQGSFLLRASWCGTPNMPLSRRIICSRKPLRRRSLPLPSLVYLETV